MKNIYKNYPTGAFTPSIDNFVATKIYITWKSHDYIPRPEKFEKMEMLTLGKPIELEYGKYIYNNYFGKIKTVGLVTAWYNKETKNVELKLDTLIQGNTFNEEAKTRLKQCIFTQIISDNNNYTEKSLCMKKEWCFIEVYEAIAGKGDILYRQKELYDTVMCFDKNGSIKKIFPEKRYFKITDKIEFDTETEVFMKGDKQILFQSHNAEKKKIFLQELIKNFPNKITKEYLIEKLGYNNNKQLLDLKRSFIETELIKYLKIDKEIIDDIIIAHKNQGYKIQGEFINSLPEKII